MFEILGALQHNGNIKINCLKLKMTAQPPCPESEINKLIYAQGNFSQHTQEYLFFSFESSYTY